MEKLEGIMRELQSKNLMVHPVRPGKELCRNFRSFNTCRFGNSCKNNHILPKFTESIVVDEGQRFDVRIGRLVELMGMLAVAIPGCKIDERYDDMNGMNTHLNLLFDFLNESEQIVRDIMAIEVDIDGTQIMSYYDGHLQKVELFRYSIPLVRVALLDYIIRDNTFVEGDETHKPNASTTYKRIFNDIDGKLAKLSDDFNMNENQMIETFYSTLYQITNPSQRIYHSAAVESAHRHFVDQLSTVLQSACDNEHILIGEINAARESVQSHIQSVIEQSIFPNSYPEILPFGSSQNTFGSAKSDIDLSLTFRQSQNINLDSWFINETVYSSLPSKILYVLSVELTKDTYSLREIVVNARVPVLKLKHIETEIDIDICYENRNGVMNTILLKKYADYDARVRPLMFAIKSWCGRRGISDSTNGTLTSYGWNLLVIHFLQCCRILPYFKVETSETNKEIVLLGIEGADEHTRRFNQSLTVGDLFLQFFLYYGNQSIYSYNSVINVVYVNDNSSRVKQCFQAIEKILYLDKYPEKLSEPSYLSTIAWQSERKYQNQSMDPSSFVSSVVSRNAIYSWRICIEDPFEDYDVGKVFHKVTGSRHVMNELRRVVGLIMKFIVEMPHCDSVEAVTAAISAVDIEGSSSQDAVDIEGSSSEAVIAAISAVDIEGSSSEAVTAAISAVDIEGSSVEAVIAAISAVDIEGSSSQEASKSSAQNFHDLLNKTNSEIPVIEFTCFGCGAVGHNLSVCTVIQGRDACHVCGEMGHFGKDCDKKRQSVKCFTCGQSGHVKNDCPKKYSKKGNDRKGGGAGGYIGKRK